MCIICCISHDATAVQDKAGDAANAAVALPGGPAGGAGGAGPDLALIVLLLAVYSASSSQHCLFGAPRGWCCRDGVQPSAGAGKAGGGWTWFLTLRQGLQTGGGRELHSQGPRCKAPSHSPALSCRS